MSARYAVVIASVIVALSTGIAGEVEHNGQWWRDQNPTEKYRYAARMFDGLTVGSNFLEFGMSVQVVVNPVPSSRRTQASQQYVRFDGGQLVEGLDRLYADPRNAAITVPRASQVFVQSLAGTPRATLQKMIEEFRKPGC